MQEADRPPHEPEIEWLGRMARRVLHGLRAALWSGGAIAVAYGVWRSATPTADVPAPVNALGSVWLCVGLPALAPTDWLFGRGRGIALAVSAVLWFAPLLLPGDSRYGFVLRIAATFVAAASLLVWRTLSQLTAAPPAAGDGR